MQNGIVYVVIGKRDVSKLVISLQTVRAFTDIPIIIWVDDDTILNTLKEDIPDLQSGAFLHLLDNDKIEGITKNTEGWLENFRQLTVFKNRL